MKESNGIDLNALTIVNYCHPSCEWGKNIMRLPKDEAFTLAKQLSESNPNDKAFGRFADFDNYYKLRVEQDQYIYDLFCSLGGKPVEQHPLSFVLEGSNYLKEWFSHGSIIKLQLNRIPSHAISFTYGDSGASYQRRKMVSMFTKEDLYHMIQSFKGNKEEFMEHIESTYHYIEVQLWDDSFIKKSK